MSYMTPYNPKQLQPYMPNFSGPNGTIMPSPQTQPQPWPTAPMPFGAGSSPTQHILSYLPPKPIQRIPMPVQTAPQQQQKPVPLGLANRYPVAPMQQAGGMGTGANAGSPIIGYNPNGTPQYGAPMPQGAGQAGSTDPEVQNSLARMYAMQQAQGNLQGNGSPGAVLQGLQNQSNISNEQRYQELLNMVNQSRTDRMGALSGLSQQMLGLSGQNQNQMIGLQNQNQNQMMQLAGGNQQAMQQLLASIADQRQQLLGDTYQQSMGANSALAGQLGGINNAQSQEMRNALTGNFNQQMALAGTGIDAALQREGRRRTNELGSAQQGAISRGLGNTTITDSLRRGVVDDSALREQGIYDAAQQQKLGVLQNFGPQQQALLGSLYGNQYNTASSLGNQRMGLMQNFGQQGDTLLRDLYNNQSGILGQGNSQLMSILGQGNQNLMNILGQGNSQQMGVLNGLNSNVQSILGGLFNDKANIIQNRTDAPPDMALYAQLLSQPGAAFGLNNQQQQQGGGNPYTSGNPYGSNQPQGMQQQPNMNYYLQGAGMTPNNYSASGTFRGIQPMSGGTGFAPPPPPPPPPSPGYFGGSYMTPMAGEHDPRLAPARNTTYMPGAIGGHTTPNPAGGIMGGLFNQYNAAATADSQLQQGAPTGAPQQQQQAGLAQMLMQLLSGRSGQPNVAPQQQQQTPWNGPVLPYSSTPWNPIGTVRGY